MCGQYIDTAELGRLYAEEVMLEEYRKMNRFPVRTLPLDKVPANMTARMIELFKEPKDYQLRKLLSPKWPTRERAGV